MNGNWLRRFAVTVASGLVLVSLMGSVTGIWAIKSELVEIRTMLDHRIMPMVSDHESRIRNLEQAEYGP